MIIPNENRVQEHPECGQIEVHVKADEDILHDSLAAKYVQSRRNGEPDYDESVVIVNNKAQKQLNSS